MNHKASIAQHHEARGMEYGKLGKSLCRYRGFVDEPPGGLLDQRQGHQTCGVPGYHLTFGCPDPDV